ncbi:MAG: galactosyltransferase-related protein [Bacillota bacterium]|nr:galactosyltransferase-related protein [Bacillota bacterium]MDP4156662.1 galactosyltransferase-related protein [Bacillota bacterium]
MLDKVSILIPFVSNDEDRNEAFKWVKKFYENTLPEAEICIGVTEADPFSKSKAVNHAASLATRDIFVIADSDIIYDPSLILQSVRLIEKHPWVIPYQKVFNLDAESTAELLKYEPVWPIPFVYSGRQRPQMGWGGINIVQRHQFERVAGFDERFQGWGGEDDAFAFSLLYLFGRPYRIDTSIFHLWHPPGKLTHYNSNRSYLKAYLAGTDSTLKEIEKRKNYKEER